LCRFLVEGSLLLDLLLRTAVRQSPDRRLALYRKDLGGDHKVFRFVIWTENAPQLNGKGRQVS
jgi:hypothetical protein